MIVRLSPDTSVKLLEEPCIYNRATDELYIVGADALDLLNRSAAGIERPTAGPEAEFVDYCLDEGLMVEAARTAGRTLTLSQAPIPSLRYLLLHLNDDCNLACRHCFLGEPRLRELSLDEASRVVDEFEQMQGLRLLVSGGEPLLHPSFWDINEYVAGKQLRAILLTNGTLIDDGVARRLRFQEVQVSIDGMRESHELLRGHGTFERALQGVRSLKRAGISVAVATMVHTGNLQDFDELASLLRELGVEKWSIDVPSPSGRMAADAQLIPDPAAAGPLLGHAFGGAIHDPLAGYACGAHLMAVMADGQAARCGFYRDSPVGHISEGLAHCWSKVDKIELDRLDCDCDLLADCRGGCRYRASRYTGETGPDPCQCYRHGVAP